MVTGKSISSRIMISPQTQKSPSNAEGLFTVRSNPMPNTFLFPNALLFLCLWFLSLILFYAIVKAAVLNGVRLANAELIESVREIAALEKAHEVMSLRPLTGPFETNINARDWVSNPPMGRFTSAEILSSGSGSMPTCWTELSIRRGMEYLRSNIVCRENARILAISGRVGD